MKKFQRTVIFPLTVIVFWLFCGSAFASDLTRTNTRSDYPALTDAEFANFRMVHTTGIGEGILYRSSSPVNPGLGRDSYADAAAEAAGIKYFINLADTEETARDRAGYDETYYAKQNILFLAFDNKLTTQHDREGLVAAMQYLADHEGPFLIHCNEGRNRAGFVCALIECLCGASFDEITDDYMLSYTNYYGIEPGNSEYDEIESDFRGKFSSICGTDSPTSADLTAAARTYLIGCGSSDALLDAVASRLGEGLNK